MMFRDVVEESRFAQDMDGLRKIYPAMDDIHAMITYSLGRDPRLGQQLDRFPDFRVWQVPGVGKTPTCWVLYSFDAERVYLHSIDIANRNESE